MEKYYTVFYTKGEDTIVSNMNFEKRSEAVKFAEKNVDEYDDAIVYRVIETDSKVTTKMVEAIYNNKNS